MTAVVDLPRREMATEDLVGSFGPEHPAVPGFRLQLTLDGEQVRAAEVELGFRHRGLEKLAEDGWTAAQVVARLVDPLAPHALATAYAAAVEGLAEIVLPARAAWLRVAAVELERASSHLATLERLASLLDLPSAARLAAELRSQLRRPLGRLTGEAGPGFVVPGGVASPADHGCERLGDDLSAVRQGLPGLARLLTDHRLVRRRLEGLGPLSRQAARELGASGPVLRACGIAADARLVSARYSELGFEPVVREAGHALARLEVRVAEIDQALVLAERAAAHVSEAGASGAGAEAHPSSPLPAGWSHGVVEGPRGEVRVLVVSDGSDRPVRVAFRGPSLLHVSLLAHLLPGCLYADVPLLVASLDLSLEEAER